MSRGDTSIITHFCKHDCCGHQRITEINGSEARKVYLQGDFLR